MEYSWQDFKLYGLRGIILNMCESEKDILYRKKLEKQLIEAHGKVEYTYTAHHKIENRIIIYDKVIRILQIVLTAISTGGFLATIITNQSVLSWIGGIAAALSLAINLYSKDFKLQTDARAHKDAADELWDIREDYVSLITDLDSMTLDEIKNKRDFLKAAVSKINKKYPGTDRRGYKQAQKALKEEEEQTFNEGEAEMLLPTSLRNKE